MQPYELRDRFQYGNAEFHLNYYFSRPTPLWNKMPNHWHKEWEMIHVLQGSMTLFLNGREYRVSAGDVLLMWSGMLHGGITENCDYESIVFDLRDIFHSAEPIRKVLSPIYNLRILPQNHFTEQDHPFLTKLTGILMSAARTGEAEPEKQSFCRLMVLGNLCSIFAYILENHLYSDKNSSQSKKEDSGWPDNINKLDIIRQALAYIENNYQNPISLDGLSSLCGTSPNHFCRTFKEVTRQTAMEYIISYRLERAINLLSATDLSITEIAQECGFNNYSYFIRTFKKAIGTTPHHYRLQRKEEAAREG